MDAKWVEYVGGATPRVEGPVAVVGKGSSVRLSKEATDLIGDPERVVFLYDRRGQRVAVRRSSTDVGHSFPLKRYGSAQMVTLSAGGFLRWAGIDSNERRRFAIEKLDDATICFAVGDAQQEPGEFEEFIYKSVALSSLSPNVSIGRNGNIGLNRAAHELLGGAEWAVFLADPEQRLIGLRPAADELHARRVRPVKNQSTWTMSGEGFLKQFGFMEAGGRSYEPYLQDQTLVVDLNRPKPSKRKRGAAKEPDDSRARGEFE